MRWVKSVILLCLTAYLCYVLPQLDSINAVFAATLCLSLLVGAVNFYWYIIRTTAQSLTFNLDGWITWFLGRRAVTYLIILGLAFVSSLCFIIHVPSLNTVGFGFIFLTAPLFAAVYYCWQKICIRSRFTLRVLVGL